MKGLAAPALILAVGAAFATPAASGPTSSRPEKAMPGVADPVRARQHWILQCQGCHRAAATGTPQTAPTMAGFVARFLQVPGGGAYLDGVPGVPPAALAGAPMGGGGH